MSKAAIRQPMGSGSAEPQRPAVPKRSKLAAFLVTGDAELWPQIGAHLANKLTFRQLDSIGELLGSVPPDLPAVLVWDARSSADRQADLSKLQGHSARFGVIVLDDPGYEWDPAIERGQLVAWMPLPVDQSRLIGALGSAYEEAHARTALLGDPVTGASLSGGGVWTFLSTALFSAFGLAVGTAVIMSGHGGDLPSSPAVRAKMSFIDASFTDGEWTAPVAAPATPEAEAVEAKVDALMAQAQHAMRDRHFVEPAEGSALALYRGALMLDPANGEAKQGLQRLLEVLIARAQSALEERQFDAALQALESARGIDPRDRRLPALDERVAKLRAELGPAEIQAAINAQNFDRAGQLIDQAARARTIGEARLNALREDLRRHRADSDGTRLVALVDQRMQQDQLIEPPGDSAAFYLVQARKAGAPAAALQAQVRELSRRLSIAARTAAAQQHFDEADRLIAQLRDIGAPASQVAALQKELDGARSQRAPEISAQSRLAELARTRLAQGMVAEPPGDSALHYLDQLRALDPQNAALGALNRAVQTQLLAQARSALDASQPAQAAALLDLAAPLGPSSDADSLRDRLRVARVVVSGPSEVAESSLTRTRTLSVDYPTGALAKQIEGSVELAYTVTPKGTVSNVRVLNSKPPGVFDRSATAAVERMRYKPVREGGQAVAVTTKMLVTYRLAK